MSKAKELRDQSSEELEVNLEAAYKKLFDLRNYLKSDKKTDKRGELKNIRKDIARILTVMTEKRYRIREEILD